MDDLYRCLCDPPPTWEPVREPSKRSASYVMVVFETPSIFFCGMLLCCFVRTGRPPPDRHARNRDKRRPAILQFATYFSKWLFLGDCRARLYSIIVPFFLSCMEEMGAVSGTLLALFCSIDVTTLERSSLSFVWRLCVCGLLTCLVCVRMYSSYVCGFRTIVFFVRVCSSYVCGPFTYIFFVHIWLSCVCGLHACVSDLLALFLVDIGKLPSLYPVTWRVQEGLP